MLKHLYISQFALIDTLDLDIDRGFSVITGETGAGKSVIMGALAMVMGERADSRVVRAGAAKSVIEATFSLTDSSLHDVFDRAELDYADECTIRREITSAGKSRAFVNDTPVNQTTLRIITHHLIDIHSQYENLLLADSNFQLSVVDTAAADDEELSAFRIAWDEYNACRRDLEQLTAEADRLRTERDYMQFQFDRLDEAGLLDPDEQDTLEQELARLNHTEEIKTDIAAALTLLDDEYGIISRMKEAKGRVEGASRFLPDINPLAERLSGLYIELKDIDGELNTHFSDLEFDPARKLHIETRLDTIYTLQQKHHLSSCAELIALRDQLSDRLQRIDSFDDDIRRLTDTLASHTDRLTAAASALTARRAAVTADIAAYLVEQLVPLGMPNAKVEVRITPLPQYRASGADDIQFLFSANKNTPLRPISSVASGGEIARVMLALKSLLTRTSQLSTIIFDEIDTGVSGEIAHRMADLMRTMSGHTQVITITHLPQIAARGTHHYKVYKTDTDTTTTTHISILSPDERIREIAEMLSGKNPTPTALHAAAELIAQP